MHALDIYSQLGYQIIGDHPDFNKQKESVKKLQKNPQCFLSKSISFEQLPQVDFEEKWKTQMSNDLWDCTKKIREKLEKGCIYTFRLKKKYFRILNTPDLDEKITNLNNKNFPAVEIDPTDLLWLSADHALFCEVVGRRSIAFEARYHTLGIYREFTESQALNQKFLLEIKNIINELGYTIKRTSKNFYLNLPDRHVLLKRWKNLQQNQPQLNLQNLTIAPSKGISSDKKLIETFLSQDYLLSSEREFVHDHLNHILPIIDHLLIEKILKLPKVSTRYAFAKINWIKKIYPIYYKILNKEQIDCLPNKSQPQLLHSLSTLIDVVASQAFFTEKASIPSKAYEDILVIYEDDRWKKYWEKKVLISDEGYLSFPKLIEILKLLEDG